MSLALRVLQPQRSFFKNLALLAQYRELLVTWTYREIRTRYRQSVLGLGWTVIQPVFQMVVISIIFGNFLRIPSEGVPYPVFAYTAILPWTLFSTSVASAVPGVISNMDLVTKIYFPREILPLSAILARLVDFAVASVVFVGLMLWYQIPLHATVLYVPLLLAIQMLLATGIGLLGAAASVFLRDISFAVPMAMQLWMYATPVIYPMSVVPERWRPLYLLNPMAGLIDSYRRVILDGAAPDFQYLGASALLSILVALVGYYNFKRLEATMSDVI
ncbi:MAG: ABC transporter permease [Caldilineaceae bacterium]|nr:ABC transporter permease [Caldilineaceae bacterium]